MKERLKVSRGSRRLVVGALIVDNVDDPVRVLAARRSTPPAGRWEFPGGKAEASESPQEALVREIREELGVTVSIGQRLDPPSGGRWPISDSLEMELFWCVADNEAGTGDSHDELRWLTAADLASVDWLDADRESLPHVAAGMRQV